MPTTPPEGSAGVDYSAPATTPRYRIQSSLPVSLQLDMVGNISENWKNWSKCGIRSKSSHVSTSRKTSTVLLLSLPVLDLKPSKSTMHGLPFENEEDKHIMSTIVELMERHCIGQTNVIYERYCFNKRNQESGESFDTYLTALRTLAKTYDFGSLTDELIRDRIVRGIRDTETRKKLLQEPKLTLQKCIDVCRSAETTAEQMKGMNGKEEVNLLHS